MDFSNVLNDTFTVVLLVLLVVSFLLLCLYYGMTWMRVGLYKGKKLPSADSVSAADLPSVSVVLVAHNESEFLKESLPYLLEQDYPNYEVVVVDYTSRDDTEFVLQVCSENYPNLKAINFAEDVNMFRGKKYPLSIGIKSAKNDIILLTEPDSVPKNFGWIREMMCGFMRGASIVMGYSLLKNGKGMLAAFEQYDSMAHSASYLGMALAGKPYSATGRNLAYSRDFFFSHGGFISHYSLPEGSDALFVNQNASGANTAVMLTSDAAVMYDHRPTFKLWHQDRIEQFIPAHSFKTADKLRLAVYPLMQMLFLVAAVLLLLGGIFPWQIVAAVVAVKFIWQIVCSTLYAKRFEIKLVQFFAPFFEFYFLFANTILYLFTLRRGNK